MWYLRSSCFAFVCVSILSFAGVNAVRAQPTASDTQTTMASTLPEDSALSTQADAVVIVGDLLGVLDKTEKFVQKVSPETSSPQLKQQVGQMIGDPNLQGIPEKGGAVFVTSALNGKVAFLEVRPDKIDAYSKTLDQRGLQTEKAGKDLLVISTATEGVQFGKKLASLVKEQLLTSKRFAGVRVILPVDRLIREHDEQIRQMITSLPQMVAMGQQMAASRGDMQMPPTTVTARLIEGELRFFYQIAKKLKTVEVSLDIPEQGVRVDSLFVPKAPVSTAAQLPTAVNLRKLVTSKGALRGVAVYDAEALMKSMASELSTVLDEMDVRGPERERIIALTLQWSKIAGNGTAFDLMFPGEKNYSGSAVTLVKDPKATLELLQKFPEQMKTSGLDQFYKTMGYNMNVLFTPNARQVKGIPVHQLKVDMESSGTLAGKTMFGKMPGSGTYEMAFVGNYLVYSVGSQSIEPLITAAQSGQNPESTPLVAERLFGEGANVYMDYAFGEVFRMMSQQIQDTTTASLQATQAMKQMASALQGTGPVSFAWFTMPTAYRSSLLVPTSLIQGFAKAGHSSKASNEEE